MKKHDCPFKKDGWDAECDLILKYFCPFAAIPIMDEAIKENRENCPNSG